MRDLQQGECLLLGVSRFGITENQSTLKTWTYGRHYHSTKRYIVIARTGHFTITEFRNKELAEVAGYERDGRLLELVMLCNA